jgi:hypothetical protein
MRCIGLCPYFFTSASIESPTWRFWTNCVGALEGEGLPEGLCGREGWRSILLGGAIWVEESWVLGLL